MIWPTLVERPVDPRGLLDSDPTVRDYFAGETTALPEFYRAQIQRDLGAWWPALLLRPLPRLQPNRQPRQHLLPKRRQ